MTPADHAALSAQLARALGYYPESVEIHQNGSCHVYRCLAHRVPIYECWHLFDYRDPSVAMPVLEWLMRERDCYPLGPEKDEDGNTVRKGYEVWQRLMHGSRLLGKADTLHEAIARAAIAVGGGK